jgi:type VI protein secretion system component Hcp
MAHQYYVTIKGTKQGQIKGQSTGSRGQSKSVAVTGFNYPVTAPRLQSSSGAAGFGTKIPVISVSHIPAGLTGRPSSSLDYGAGTEAGGFDFPVTTPTGPGSGLTGGKHGHRPIRLTIGAGGAATQLFQAFCNREVLSEVVIEPQPETVVARISLTNATISESSRYGPGMTPSLGGQGSGKSSSSGKGKPEPVAERITLTNALITKYASANSARGSSNGLGLISIELTYSAISYKPPRG